MSGHLNFGRLQRSEHIHLLEKRRLPAYGRGLEVPERMRRKLLSFTLTTIACALVIHIAFLRCSLAVELTLPDPLAAELSEGRLATWEDNVVETGVGLGDIPAISYPQFLNTQDASLVLDDEDVVFVADFGGQDQRIYPQNILAWHQVVNDVTDAGEFVSVTYCPLTGTLAGYKGALENRTLGFGVTGNLVNNNSILYDQNTGSFWPQITGVAFAGPLKGKRLTRFPMLWTTWEQASEVFPEAKVLSRSTGFSRTYDRDPYGDYSKGGSYYFDEMIVYPLTKWDKRLPPKERIYAFPSDSGQTYGLRKDQVAQRKVVQFLANLTPMVALYDPRLQLVRVFRRTIEGQTLDLEFVGGEIRDKQSKSTWDPAGRCLSGALWGENLPRVTGFDTFWFAYAAFFPAVEIIPPLQGGQEQW